VSRRTGAILCALAAPLFVATAATASAEPDPAPPNCTAADLAGVMTGVAASTSAYLFTHPEVNDFFTGLRGKSEDEKRTAVEDYMTSHPQVAAELRGIRQPSVDFRNRCE
jgi:heme-binding protein